MPRIDWKDTIIPKVNELLGSYGFRPTLRQVFYRLVAALLIPNTETTYKSLSRATVLAREQEIIEPMAFEDRMRGYEGGDEGWETGQGYVDALLQGLSEAPERYVRPMWTSQQSRPIIWLEKDALMTPVTQIADRFRVRTYAARGYSSFSAVYEAAQEIYGGVHVLQLTDFDPSGEDMVRDLRDRLTRYGAQDFDVTKIALSSSQVASLGLPPMPAKRADPRYDAFAASYGDEVVELDALPPDELERIIAQAIEDLIDPDFWDPAQAREEEEREEAQRLIEEILRKLRE